MHEPSASHNLPLLGCFAGTFKPSARQIRSHTLGVHLPAGHLQKVSDAPVTVAAEATGQSDDRRGERVLIPQHLVSVTLAGTMLTESLTGPAFRYVQPLTDRLDAFASPREALEVSPGSFLEDQLVEREVRDRLA